MEKLQIKIHMYCSLVVCVTLKPKDQQIIQIITFKKYIKYPHLGFLGHHHQYMQDMGKMKNIL